METTALYCVNHAMIHWATTRVAVLGRECVWRGMGTQTATVLTVQWQTDAVRELVCVCLPVAISIINHYVQSYAGCKNNML